MIGIFVMMLASAASQTAAHTFALDIDGDGKMDRVTIEGTTEAGKLVAYRAVAPTTPIAITEIDSPATFFVSVVEPGQYPTACGKGAGKSASCTAKTKAFVRPTLVYGTREASAIAAVWNGSGFDAVSLSD